jgi:hypothetical protein
MSHKQGLGTWLQGHRGEAHLEGAAAASRWRLKQRKSRFFAPKGYSTWKDRSLFQRLARQIRYLADQWQIN